MRGGRGRGAGLVLGLLLHVTRGRRREQQHPRRVSGGLVWGRDRVLTCNLSAPRGPLYSPLRAPQGLPAPRLVGWPSPNQEPGGPALDSHFRGGGPGTHVPPAMGAGGAADLAPLPAQVRCFSKSILSTLPSPASSVTQLPCRREGAVCGLVAERGR